MLDPRAGEPGELLVAFPRPAVALPLVDDVFHAAAVYLAAVDLERSSSGAPPRRWRRRFTKALSVHGVQRSDPSLQLRRAMRTARVDLQRWRQRRASTDIRTASSEGSEDRTSRRTSSGSALRRSSPPAAAAVALSGIAPNWLRACRCSPGKKATADGLRTIPSASWGGWGTGRAWRRRRVDGGRVGGERVEGGRNYGM